MPEETTTDPTGSTGPSAPTDPTRNVLHERLFDELVDTGASNLAVDLALAAFDGPETLADTLAGLADPAGGIAAGVTASPAPTPVPVPRQRASADASSIPGMYLTSIKVRGFRGVGPETTLRLRPGNGLTLITGRNGSGKSTFAEALELALTGTNERLQRGRIWKDGWRNLHAAAGEPPRIEVELTAEGSPRPIQVVRAWQAADADLLAATSTVRAPGRRQRPLAELPWREALTEYRPFLAYSELSGLITDGDAKIFDAMGGILRLRPLTETHTRLQQAHSELDRAHKAVRAGRESLLAALASSTDGRATAIRTALDPKTPRKWDLDAAHVAAAGGTAVGGPGGGVDDLTGAGGSTGDEVAALRRLLSLAVPDSDEVASRIVDLRAAATDVDALAATPAAHARRVAVLLRAGLDHYREHGGDTCPLCGVGALDEAWQLSAEVEAERLGALAGNVDVAHTRFRGALTAALAIVTEPPRVLTSSPIPTVGAGELTDAVERARGAWEEWEQLRGPAAFGQLADEPARWLTDEVTDELAERHHALLAAVSTLRSAAHTRLGAVEAEWSPLARQTLEWVEAARRDRLRAPALAALKEARDFARNLLERLRDERLTPFAEQQQAIWADLRQESNVELGPVRLRGTATRRRLVLDVTVDGADGAALGVMSQGELHALGLALFIPRATVSESPFRFVVIDDPVQAMDPAKVDGLARVLLRTAETRQVVVFTHDDRLADAIRRFSPRGFPSHQLDVVRAEQSVVEVRPALDPANRWLDEARALVATGSLPDDIRSTLVPLFCRSAVDAVCTDIYRRKRLAAGDRHQDVENAIIAAHRTAEKASLALFGDITQENKVADRISNKWGRSVGAFYKNLKEGGHAPWGSDLGGLVRDCTNLVDKLGELR